MLIYIYIYIYPLALRANPATVPGVKLVRLVKLVKLVTLSKIDPKSSQNLPNIDQKSIKID